MDKSEERGEQLPNQSTKGDPNAHLTPFGRFVVTWAGAGVGAGLAAIIGVYQAIEATGFIFRHLSAFLRAHHLEVVFHGIVLLTMMSCALVLYRIRCTTRRLYGMMEICCGLAAGLFAAETILTSRSPNDLLALQVIVPVVGGLFMCIRGLSNLEDFLWARKPLVPATDSQRVWWKLFHKSLIIKEAKAG